MDVGSASQSPTGMVTPPASNKESGGLGDGTAQARPRSRRDRTGQDNEGSAALVGWASSRTSLAGWPQAGWPGWSRWLRLECRATNGRCFWRGTTRCLLELHRGGSDGGGSGGDNDSGSA